MSIWEDLLEVVVVGLIAGVGISTAFALVIRGVAHAGTARRERRTGALAANGAMAAVAATICIAAVVFAFFVMLHK